MGVNHVHEHEPERSPEELARDRAQRFSAALAAVLRDHQDALVRVDDRVEDRKAR